ncbi:MAG: PIG-L deacetylase family protein [Acidimicrobiales bacterium]
MPIWPGGYRVRTVPDLAHGSETVGVPAAPEVVAMARIVTDPERVKRILVVTAHPDDVDFGASGSVAVWTDAGIDVAYCVVTDGEAGGSDRAMHRADMAAIRRGEQRVAATQVGVNEITFLGYPDGSLTPSIELRRDITRVIRTFRPDRVVTQSPERHWARIYASHPDHLATGEATTCAVYPDARNPFAHPELLAEGLDPHVVPELWVMATDRADRAVDVTATFDRKLAALRSHRSQVGEGEHLPDMLRGWMSGTAKAAGLPEGSLSEAYHVVPTG